MKLEKCTKFPVEHIVKYKLNNKIYFFIKIYER